MINSPVKFSWLLLDHKGSLQRERSGGFSRYERKGERALEKLPYCPVCRRQVWPHATTFMEKIIFTGILLGDASWTYGNDFIVSERFLKSWHKSGLKGLSFSNNPLKVSFKRKIVVAPSSELFFIALPEPRITRFFLDESGAVYSEAPYCVICYSSEVKRINKLIFAEDPLNDSDCFLPSCLPGWTVVSSRFREFIEDNKLMNFNFLEGFNKKRDGSLIKKGFWEQKPNGLFEYIDVC